MLLPNSSLVSDNCLSSSKVCLIKCVELLNSAKTSHVVSPAKYYTPTRGTDMQSYLISNQRWSKKTTYPNCKNIKTYMISRKFKSTKVLGFNKPQKKDYLGSKKSLFSRLVLSSYKHKLFFYDPKCFFQQLENLEEEKIETLLSPCGVLNPTQIFSFVNLDFYDVRCKVLDQIIFIS